MRRVVRAGGRWLVVGTQGVVEATYEEYLQATYHATTGQPAPELAECRKRIRAMIKRLS